MSPRGRTLWLALWVASDGLRPFSLHTELRHDTPQTPEIGIPCTPMDPLVYAPNMNLTKGQTMNTQRVIGYARVSTQEQHEAGAGLPAQISRLEGEGAARGWALETVTESGGRSGSSMTKREALAEAIARLDRGEADALAVTKLDRLTRSVADFSRLLDHAQRKGWDLIILDVNVDTSTPSGALVANILASSAQYERALIAQRTREGMAQRKAEGQRMGRPVVMAEETRARISELRSLGLSLRAIAQELNEAEIPTAHGGKAWHASTVSNVLVSV